MNLKGQQLVVFNHLKSIGPITPRYGIYEYEIYRLADVILKLRRKGCDIHTEMVPHNGGGKFARYHLVKGPKRA